MSLYLEASLRKLQRFLEFLPLRRLVIDPPGPMSCRYLFLLPRQARDQVDCPSHLEEHPIQIDEWPFPSQQAFQDPRRL